MHFEKGASFGLIGVKFAFIPHYVIIYCSILLYLRSLSLVIMHSISNEISVERLLEQDIPELVRYNKDIIMMNNFGDMKLFSHPARLKATTVLICLSGEIDCSINLKNFHITENHMLVNFAGDVIHISRAENIAGYAIIISEEYLRQLQLDFRIRVQSYVSLHDNGPINVPIEELIALKPYYSLLKKNMEDGNPDVIKGLAIALSYTIISMMKRYQPYSSSEMERNEPRAQQIFDKFMKLLNIYHTKERCLKFYAEKMCLTPKYISGMIKNYSGNGAMEWINEYVVLEAKMMLRYTEMTVQEIAYALNFPTQSAFGKYFKQHLGISPKRYRIEG